MTEPASSRAASRRAYPAERATRPGAGPRVDLAVVVEQLGRREPQRQLGDGRLRPIRRMDDVLRGLEREVAADRARRSLVGTRGAVDRADDRDRVRPLQRERDQR